MSAYDIPPHRQAELDRNHAEGDQGLDKLLEMLALQGLATLDPPARVLGIHNALKANTRSGEVFMLAAFAVSRLFDTDNTDPAEGTDLS